MAKMNLVGTLVIFDHCEYGSVDNTTVMYISPESDLDKKLELFVELTGYPLDHERYDTEILDLSKYYFGLHYGADVSDVTKLIKEYAPEILEDAQEGQAYGGKLIRQYRHSGRQTWLNRLYPEVREFIKTTLEARANDKTHRTN